MIDLIRLLQQKDFGNDKKLKLFMALKISHPNIKFHLKIWIIKEFCYNAKDVKDYNQSYNNPHPKL